MKKRCSILLLEFLIALLIMGMVFEILFLGYRHALAIKQQFHKEKEIVLGRQRLLLRMRTIFRTMQSCQEVSSGWLVRYEGGMDSEVSFRGSLQALISIKNNRLMLISWPAEGAPRVETLYEDQDSKKISFSFFNSKTGEFQSYFPDSKPYMMKMKVGSDLELPFFL